MQRCLASAAPLGCFYYTHGIQKLQAQQAVACRNKVVGHNRDTRAVALEMGDVVGSLDLDLGLKLGNLKIDL